MAPTAAASEAVVISQKAEPVEKELTPLQAISHGDVLPDIPTFVSFAAERRHILIHMAATFRHWARQNFTEGQSGHISVRDPEFPGMMWMNPLSRHFGMLTAGDMLLLDIETGHIAAGSPNPATGLRTSNRAGFFIHRAVHRARPHDVHSVCHAHTNSGRAWAAFGRPLEMLTQDVCTLYGAHAVYNQYGGIVFGTDEGERIAHALGTSNKAAILMSHGLLTVGSTVDEAGFLFGLMDRSCDIQLRVEAAAAAGTLKKQIISDDEAAYNFRMASEPHVLYREAQADLELEIEAAGGEEALAKGLDQLVIIRE
ncbi:class 2 aldolase adducin domain containing protein [Grosmannia clavigera kw1407]|uniref:Class 2 aldolase adducin domain containing protein n=1 Tax=Grosmannia clavigera (strain kw1407 / UAMH 11150) TaxID=655863 RepID=F0XU03_GROCL|nr:class 2 aldolase adducin domain containing protein [Grosmannia clavigera kw1407]EFW98791.1 class 2 aldolase adducin domain containing protein [Grosmannia clavigera kw1407]